jgi:hypothetical protein
MALSLGHLGKRERDASGVVEARRHQADPSSASIPGTRSSGFSEPQEGQVAIAPGR